MEPFSEKLKNAAFSGEETDILIVSCLGHFLAHYNMAMFPAIVFPLAGAFNQDISSVLNLSFWQYLLFGISALPWGMAGDRFGARPIIIIMFAGSCVSSLFVARFLDSPTAFMLGLAGVGLFSGIYHPIGMGMISKGVGRVSIALGYNAVFGGLGLVAGPLLTGIFNSIAGPKLAVLAMAAMNFVGFGAVMLYKQETCSRTSEDSVVNGSSSLRCFLILLFAMTLAGLVYTGTSSTLPAYLEIKSSSAAQTFLNAPRNLISNVMTSFVFIIGMLAIPGRFLGSATQASSDLPIVSSVRRPSLIPYESCPRLVPPGRQLRLFFLFVGSPSS